MKTQKYLLVLVLLFSSMTACVVHSEQSIETQSEESTPLIVGSPANLSGQDINNLLNAHNQARAEVGVAPLVWSDAVAQYAQEWSDNLASTRCGLEHRSPNQYGENIFMGTQGYYKPEDAVSSWASEKKDYQGGILTNDNWYAAGHYTQVVWSRTQQVGCGKSVCNNQIIVVCNYQPAGNMMGEKPF